jgi:hypothetical protein
LRALLRVSPFGVAVRRRRCVSGGLKKLQRESNHPLVETSAAYLERKHREIALIDACLATPLNFEPPDSAEVVIQRKFKLAGALRAERSLESWAITETARPEAQRWRSGAYRFSYEYQRADLHVHGPAIYDVAGAVDGRVRQETVYTGSGMSAISAIVTALIRLRGPLEVIAPRGCYGETRELLESLEACVDIVRAERPNEAPQRAAGHTRVLLIDSCVAENFGDYRATLEDIDVVVFDTTCFWQDSARLRATIRSVLRAGLPMALVRSHAKLDSLGIEYGRLGSVVLAWRSHDAGQAWMRKLLRATEDSVRLYGVAAIPAHFPPFTGTRHYRACSRARTAAIIRNTRRMARELSLRMPGTCAIRTFQHGLYFALVPKNDLPIDDVKRAAAALSTALGRQKLPLKHAGSFGFDFVAVEWFFDATLRRNLLRIAGADLPASLIDRIVDAIEAWWSANRMGTASRSSAAGVAERVVRPS